MKIHLVSDIHLDRDPNFAIASDLDFDVLVCAGDVAEDPVMAIDFLTVAAAGKPCVFVLGNHDYWQVGRKGIFDRVPDKMVDMEDRLAEIKALAPPNIHVLEKESVIIEAGGDRIRFLGCTFWTSYNDADPVYMAMGALNDSVYISSRKWHERNPEARRDYLRTQGDESHFQWHESDPKIYDRFHQVVALDLHRKSLAWLNTELVADGEWDSTVIVTHHAPSWSVLEASGMLSRSVKELTLKDHIENLRRGTCGFSRMDRDDAGTYRLASYASPLDNFIRRHRDVVAVWCHGHIHSATDIAIHSVRVIANPRRSHHFNERLILDPFDVMWEPFVRDVEKSIPDFQKLLAEFDALLPHIRHTTPAIRLSVREAYEKRVLTFLDAMTKITNFIHENLGDATFEHNLAIRTAGFNFLTRVIRHDLTFDDQTWGRNRYRPNVRSHLKNMRLFVKELAIVLKLRSLRSRREQQIRKEILAALIAQGLTPVWNDELSREGYLMVSVAAGEGKKIEWRTLRRHGFSISWIERREGEDR
jgi:hypothetical protein